MGIVIASHYDVLLSLHTLETLTRIHTTHRIATSHSHKSVKDVEGGAKLLEKITQKKNSMDSGGI